MGPVKPKHLEDHPYRTGVALLAMKNGHWERTLCACCLNCNCAMASCSSGGTEEYPSVTTKLQPKHGVVCSKDYFSVKNAMLTRANIVQLFQKSAVVRTERLDPERIELIKEHLLYEGLCQKRLQKTKREEEQFVRAVKKKQEKKRKKRNQNLTKKTTRANNGLRGTPTLQLRANEPLPAIVTNCETAAGTVPDLAIPTATPCTPHASVPVPAAAAPAAVAPVVAAPAAATPAVAQIELPLVPAIKADPDADVETLQAPRSVPFVVIPAGNVPGATCRNSVAGVSQVHAIGPVSPPKVDAAVERRVPVIRVRDPASLGIDSSRFRDENRIPDESDTTQRNDNRVAPSGVNVLPAEDNRVPCGDTRNRNPANPSESNTTPNVACSSGNNVLANMNDTVSLNMKHVANVAGFIDKVWSELLNLTLSFDRMRSLQGGPNLAAENTFRVRCFQLNQYLSTKRPVFIKTVELVAARLGTARTNRLIAEKVRELRWNHPGNSGGYTQLHLGLVVKLITNQQQHLNNFFGLVDSHAPSPPPPPSTVAPTTPLATGNHYETPVPLPEVVNVFSHGQTSGGNNYVVANNGVLRQVDPATDNSNSSSAGYPGKANTAANFHGKTTASDSGYHRNANVSAISNSFIGNASIIETPTTITINIGNHIDATTISNGFSGNATTTANTTGFQRNTNATDSGYRRTLATTSSGSHGNTSAASNSFLGNTYTTTTTTNSGNHANITSIMNGFPGNSIITTTTTTGFGRTTTATNGGLQKITATTSSGSHGNTSTASNSYHGNTFPSNKSGNHRKTMTTTNLYAGKTNPSNSVCQKYSNTTGIGNHGTTATSSNGLPGNYITTRNGYPRNTPATSNGFQRNAATSSVGNHGTGTNSSNGLPGNHTTTSNGDLGNPRTANNGLQSSSYVTSNGFHVNTTATKNGVYEVRVTATDNTSQVNATATSNGITRGSNSNLSSTPVGSPTLMSHLVKRITPPNPGNVQQLPILALSSPVVHSQQLNGSGLGLVMNPANTTVYGSQSSGNGNLPTLVLPNNLYSHYVDRNQSRGSGAAPLLAQNALRDTSCIVGSKAVPILPNNEPRINNSSLALQNNSQINPVPAIQSGNIAKGHQNHSNGSSPLLANSSVLKKSIGNLPIPAHTSISHGNSVNGNITQSKENRAVPAHVNMTLGSLGNPPVAGNNIDITHTDSVLASRPLTDVPIAAATNHAYVITSTTTNAQVPGMRKRTFQDAGLLEQRMEEQTRKKEAVTLSRRQTHVVMSRQGATIAELSTKRCYLDKPKTSITAAWMLPDWDGSFGGKEIVLDDEMDVAKSCDAVKERFAVEATAGSTPATAARATSAVLKSDSGAVAVAKAGLSPGQDRETVICATFESGTSLSVDKDRCIQCNAASVGLCGACKGVAYCSEECMTIHWIRHHSKVCERTLD